MPVNKSKADSWRKNLKLISHCPVCGRDYKSKAGKLFIKHESAKFVHFTCKHCRSHFMAMVMTMPKGISTVGMLTDLNLKDVQKLYKMLPLTIDETIEGHKAFHHPDFFKNLK